MSTPPTDEFSPGTEAAKFATEFIKSNIGTIYEKTKGIFKFGKEELQLRLESTYRDYFEEVGEKYSKVKTFLINQESVELYKFYVPLGVTVQQTNYPDVSISELTLTHNFNIITGSAGSGKSMTMRHLFLDSIKQRTKVPVFIELRALNDSDLRLLDLIKQTLASFKFDLGDSFIDRGLELGHFILFLDGFDELADEKRKPIAEEIMGIGQINDQNQLIVSSRPDDFFIAWHLFRVWKIDDLTLNKACQLIDRLPFDKETRVKFIKDLRSGLFEEHKYFLSNPLLLSIMWLCYSENASIPKKLTLFYQQAYEALFNKHDAKKGGYKRNRRTPLDVQDFAEVFSAFAVQTFDENKVEFPEAKAINFLNQCKKIKNIEFNSNDFLVDCIKSVCLILEDGLKLRFSHRSFQEYFTAYFIINSNDKIQSQLLSKYLGTAIGSNNVTSMAYLMNPEKVERLLIIPEIEKLEKKIGYTGVFNIEVAKKYLNLFISTIDAEVSDQGDIHLNYSIRDTKLYSLEILVTESPEYEKAVENTGGNVGKHEATINNAFYDSFYANTPVKIEVVTRNERVMELMMEGVRINRLKLLLALKPILVEKYEGQEDSLKAILGI